jgi:hypothetical protein
MLRHEESRPEFSFPICYTFLAPPLAANRDLGLAPRIAPNERPLAGKHRAPFVRHQQVMHIVRMLFFHN